MYVYVRVCSSGADGNISIYSTNWVLNVCVWDCDIMYAVCGSMNAIIREDKKYTLYLMYTIILHNILWLVLSLVCVIVYECVYWWECVVLKLH